MADLDGLISFLDLELVVGVVSVGGCGALVTLRLRMALPGLALFEDDETLRVVETKVVDAAAAAAVEPLETLASVRVEAEPASGKLLTATPELLVVIPLTSNTLAGTLSASGER